MFMSTVLYAKGAAKIKVCSVVSFLLQTISDCFNPPLFSSLSDSLFLLSLSPTAGQRADCVLAAEERVSTLHLFCEYSISGKHACLLGLVIYCML